MVEEVNGPNLPDKINSEAIGISPPNAIGSSGLAVSLLINIKRRDSVILDGAIASLSDV